jgi:excisionase family DNA binding protein
MKREPCYRPEEAARALGIREDTVHQWITDEVLASVPRRRERLVPESEVERLLEAWSRDLRSR